MNDISKTGANLVKKDALIEAIHNLLRMKRHSRFFNRGMYCRLDDLLFSLPTFVGSKVITSEIMYMMKLVMGNNVDTVKVITEPDYDNREYKVTVLCALDNDQFTVTESLPAGTGVK